MPKQRRRARSVRRAIERSRTFAQAYGIVEPYLARGLTVAEASRAAIADGLTTRDAWDNVLGPKLMRLTRKLGLKEVSRG